MRFSDEDISWDYLAAREWDLASAMADEMIEGDNIGVRGSGYNVRGYVRFFQGHLIAGLEDWDMLITLLESQGWQEGFVAGRRSGKAMILLESGDTTGALEALPEIDDAPLFGGVYFLRGSMLFRMGKLAEGSEILSALEAMAEESLSPKTRCWVHLLTGQSHLARGEPSLAIREVEASMRMPPAERRRRWESRVLGRALTADGQASRAIDAYREFLEPSYLSSQIWVLEIPLLYELAKLEEEVGDLSSAREHYRKYLEHWGNADMPVVNVPDARKRLEALEAKL
jgi:tetratricopeptide (TPR) repeat protein